MVTIGWKKKKKSTALPLWSTIPLFSRNFPLHELRAHFAVPVNQAKTSIMWIHTYKNEYLGNLMHEEVWASFICTHLVEMMPLRLFFITTIGRHRTPIFDDWRIETLITTSMLRPKSMINVFSVKTGKFWLKLGVLDFS